MLKTNLNKPSPAKERENLEWLKSKLGALWQYPEHCGLCLETSGNFYPLKMEFAINDCYSTRPLREVVSDVMNCDIDDYTSSEIICEVCTEKVIQSYIFIFNTKKVFDILSNCVNDLLSKVTDLDYELNDNGYENANVMIVVEYDNETYRDINKITSGSNIILVNKHINRENMQIVKLAAPIEAEKKEVHINVQNSKVEGRHLVILPMPRATKHPRAEDATLVTKKPGKVKMPTFSLEGGKIVIAPSISSPHSVPKFNTYKCNSCANIFVSYRALKEHEKNLHNTTVYQCRFCSKKYISQQSLDGHYTITHGKYRCKYCHDVFSKDEFNSHLREKHAPHVYSCKLCDLVYYTVEQLETHMKSAHWANDLQTFQNKSQCVMCLRNFRDCEIKMHKCKFSCLECPVAPCVHYNYLMSFREQILSHSSKIKCLDCDYVTKRKEHLIAHVNREHLDYHPFQCDDCGTQFYTKLSLKTHIVQFHQDLRCHYCDHESKNASLLQVHTKLCKSLKRSFPCKQCVASFDTESELNKHTKFYHSDYVFPCHLCKKEFAREDALKIHHARVHNGIQYKKRRKFIECTLCDVTFRNLKEMQRHEELHDITEIFPCKHCTKTFSSLKKVYMHKQKYYSQKTKCTACNKLVAFSFLVQHQAICPALKGPLETKHICSLCGKRFKTKSTLSTHLQLHAHSKTYKLIPQTSLTKLNNEVKQVEPLVKLDKEKQVFQCEHCEYVAKKKVDCENHVNKIHLKIKPFVCTVCNKAFCGKPRLDEHIRTHSDNNICFCTFCGKKFANKVCLKMHTRRHTGEKPYECNICLERFRSSSIMKTHRLKKHQDKTIKCPLCNAMHHLVAEMRFHVKKVHWKRPEPFDFKQLVSEEFYHLFEDRRLQKLGYK